MEAAIAALHQHLNEARVPHAFALAYYGAPRTTSDSDVNLFVPAQVNELKLDWEGTPVHFFFSCDPLHKEMERGARKVPLGGGTIPLVAPEHLVIRKKLLSRPKDKLDIERIAGVTDLDREEIESWVQRLKQESEQINTGI